MIRKTMFVMAVLAFFLAAAWVGTALFLSASYKTFRIPNGSMAPTFQVDERVIVDRKAYRYAVPQRGDIVVFKLLVKGESKLHCKRVIGLPGEKLEIKDGKIFINNQPLVIPGVGESVHYQNAGSFSPIGAIVSIPPNAFFLLGDNPAHSFDSRYFGSVSASDIYGKVITNYRGKPSLQKIARFIQTNWFS